MKLVSPVSELIQQTIRLYQEMSQTAQNLHGLGPDSGAKRTILLHLYMEGDVVAGELGRIYPIAADDGLRIVIELMKSGLILKRTERGQPVLAITLPGKAFAARMLQAEAEFFRQCPVPLPMSNIREAAATLEIFLSAMKKARDEKDEVRVVGL